MFDELRAALLATPPENKRALILHEIEYQAEFYLSGSRAVEHILLWAVGRDEFKRDLSDPIFALDVVSLIPAAKFWADLCPNQQLKVCAVMNQLATRIERRWSNAVKAVPA